jgi:hypothetical protein
MDYFASGLGHDYIRITAPITTAVWLDIFLKKSTNLIRNNGALHMYTIKHFLLKLLENLKISKYWSFSTLLQMWKILYYFIMFFVPFIFLPVLYFTINFLFHIKLFDILVSTRIRSAPLDPKRLSPFISYKCRCFCLCPVSIDLTHFE